jgi:hypothetical protein
VAQRVATLSEAELAGLGLATLTRTLAVAVRLERLARGVPDPSARTADAGDPPDDDDEPWTAVDLDAPLLTADERRAALDIGAARLNGAAGPAAP